MPARPQIPCPLCGEPLYGWAKLSEPAERVFDRCESCGVAVERDGELDLARELRAVSTAGATGELSIDCPNRASAQAALGQSAWAPLDRLPGRLALTPSSLELLVARCGYTLGPVSFPPAGRNFGWMWQTIINAFTFSDNLARDVIARRHPPVRGRARVGRALDTLVSVLAAPIVALISLPLEAAAALANRGGRMVTTARRGHGDGAGG